jgi:hypothetical protein
MPERRRKLELYPGVKRRTEWELLFCLLKLNNKFSIINGNKSGCRKEEPFHKTDMMRLIITSEECGGGYGESKYS